MNGFLRATLPLRLFLWATLRRVLVLTGLPMVSATSLANFGRLVLGFLWRFRTKARSSAADSIRLRPLPPRFFKVPSYFHLFIIFCTVEWVLPTASAIARNVIPRQHILMIIVRVAISVSFLLLAIFTTKPSKTLQKTTTNNAQPMFGLLTLHTDKKSTQICNNLAYTVNIFLEIKRVRSILPHQNSHILQVFLNIQETKWFLQNFRVRIVCCTVIQIMCTKINTS